MFKMELFTKLILSHSMVSLGSSYNIVYHFSLLIFTKLTFFFHTLRNFKVLCKLRLLYVPRGVAPIPDEYLRLTPGNFSVFSVYININK